MKKAWLAAPLAASLLLAPLQTEAKVDISSISTSNSHYEGIHYFNQLNVFDYMGKQFKSADSAKRAEVAQVLYMLYKNDLKKVRNYQGFNDVTTNHPLYNAIKWSYEVGIFDGSNGVYNPNANIRRDQLAKVLVNAFDLKLVASNSLTFKDVAKSDGYYDVIRVLASHKITVGDKGYFKPKSNVTNSQLSTFVYRLYKQSDHIEDTPVTQTYDSEFAFDWTVQSSGANLRLVGIDGTKKVASYTTAKGDSVGNIVVGSSTKANVDARYPTKVTSILKGNTNYKVNTNNEYGLVEADGQYIYFFYDVHNGNKVRAIFAVNKAYEQAKPGYYGVPTADILKDYDNLMYLMLNQARQAQGLKALQISTANAAVAYNHSKDMVVNNYFSHTNKAGSGPLQRYKKAGSAGGFNYVGENIAMGQFNAIFAFEGLHNSKGHRANILDKSWTHMAIGSYANAKNQPYYTQMFFRK